MPLKSIKLVNQKDLSQLPIPPEGGILGRRRGFAIDYFRKSRFMSGAHLFIYPQGDSFYAVDKNSRNGSVLNQQPMVQGREYLLSVGDTLILADLVFTVALDKSPGECIYLDLPGKVKNRVVKWSAQAIACIKKAGDDLACERYDDCINSSGEAVFLISRVMINILGKDCDSFPDVMPLILELVEQRIISSEFYDLLFSFVASIACDLHTDPDEAADAAAGHQLALDLLRMLRDVLFNPNQHYIKV